MTIQSVSVLVDLNISCWTARKLDRKVSEEVDVAKQTRGRAGNYNKMLLPGADKLMEVSKMVGSIRTWHYEQTLPWSDGGSRLLPMLNFFEYKATLNQFEQKFDDAVRDFLAEYPQLVSAAAFQLGDLFDRNEYPDVGEITDKFRFRYSFAPLPGSGDFRIDAGEETKRELEAQYKGFFDAKLQDAYKDMWERLHVTLKALSTKLTDADKPRDTKEGPNYTQIFRDSLITNAVDLCGLLTKLNVTDDPMLEQARKQLEIAICGVSAEDVRDSDSLRMATKKKVDDILSAFSF
jgi:hypothetical protein